MKSSNLFPTLCVLLSQLDYVFAAPSRSFSPAHVVRSTFSKRGEPQIPPEFSGPDADRVDSSFSFVLDMCQNVLTLPESQVDPIFQKYFRAEDKTRVLNVFREILGTDPMDRGNQKLDTIFVQNDDPDQMCSREASLMAYMTGWEGNEPIIQMCKPGLAHKTREETTCDDLGDHVSYKMNTIATTLLHEYTHYNALTRAAAGAQIIDQPNGYGPVNVRNLNKAIARRNADSYAYFASELAWSQICQKSYLDPRPGIDDADPLCSGEACQVDSNIGEEQEVATA